MVTGPGAAAAAPGWPGAGSPRRPGLRRRGRPRRGQAGRCGPAGSSVRGRRAGAAGGKKDYRGEGGHRPARLPVAAGHDSRSWSRRRASPSPCWTPGSRGPGAGRSRRPGRGLHLRGSVTPTVTAPSSRGSSPATAPGADGERHRHRRVGARRRRIVSVKVADSQGRSTVGQVVQGLAWTDRAQGRLRHQASPTCRCRRGGAVELPHRPGGRARGGRLVLRHHRGRGRRQRRLRRAVRAGERPVRDHRRLG